MTLETDISGTNEHFFFKEFTYSKNTFSPSPSEEIELADNLIWLDELAIIFQLKERCIAGTTTPDSEEKWFSKKVVKRGTKQIRDSLRYLNEHQSINLKNHRNHRFQLEVGKLSTIHKIVCYFEHQNLPKHCRKKKFHKSSTAGIIHLIPASDYLGITRTMLTLFELSEYLSFRQELIEKWGDVVSAVPETALAGQYLLGDSDRRPDSEFVEVLKDLEHRADEWDISGLIKYFPNRVISDSNSTDYYAIVSELVKLKRNELREYKKRFQLSMDKCGSQEVVLPYRMASQRNQCGFIFVPLAEELIAGRRQGLMNLTLACKYDLRVSKCIGTSFFPERNGRFSIEWCYLEFPWEYDEELDQRLQRDNPFREVRQVELNRYNFKPKL